MNTRLDEIASGIYRVSVYIPEADFMSNQLLLDGDEPLQVFGAGQLATESRRSLDADFMII